MRFVIFSFVWALFWWFGSVYYFYYIHDVGSAYWALGGWGYLLIAIVFLAADIRLRKNKWTQDNLWKYVTLACLGGILLYYPVLLLVLIGLALVA